MTLEELQIVIYANIEQIAPQIREVQSQIGKIQNVATSVSQKTTDAAKQTADKTQRALQDTDSAEKKSAEVAKQVANQKRQSAEEIAAIAERAAKRYNDSLKGMSSGGPIREPVVLKGYTMGLSKLPEKSETPSIAPQTNALQRLQVEATKVKQKLADMFSGVNQKAPEASASVEQMVAKLDNINARADIWKRKLTELRAEYKRLSSMSWTDKGSLDKLNAKILSAESHFQSLSSQSDKLASKIREVESGCNRTATAASKAERSTSSLSNGFSRASNRASGFSRELGMMRRQLLSSIFIYGIALKGITALGTYMLSALKTNTAFVNSLNNLKASLLTAFNPIYQAALPALTTLINALAKVTQYIGAFISGFFGKSYAQSMQSAAGLNKNVNALENVGKVAKSTKKSLGDLAGFDEINKLGKKDNSADSAADVPTGKDKSLVGTNFGQMKPLISEQQIAAAEAAGTRVRAIFQKISDFAKKHTTIIKAAIAGIIGAFLAFKIVSFVVGIIQGIAGALAFLAANPIALVVLAIGALIGIIVYLYNTNKTVHDGINNAWNGLVKTVQAVWGKISGTLENAYKSYIKPIIDTIGKTMSDIWEKHLKPLGAQIQTFVGQVVEDAQPIIKFLVDVFGPIFSALMQTIVKIFGDIFNIISDVVKDVLKVLGGVLDFLAGVFTGNWSKAWKGIQEIFGGVWDVIKDIVSGVLKTIWDAISGAINLIMGAFQGVKNGIYDIFGDVGAFFTRLWNGIVGIVKGAINGILWAWNNLAGMLNNIHVDIPPWAPIGGGSTIGFNLPYATYLAHGGITQGLTPAVLGDNPGGQEAVLPLSSNNEWMNVLTDKIASKVGGSGDINLTFPIYLNRNGNLIDTLTKKIKRENRNGNVAFI